MQRPDRGRKVVAPGKSNREHGFRAQLEFTIYQEWEFPGDAGETITPSVDPNPLTQSPFAALTFVAAPALLTNASSVLALSTINRMLRTRDRMHELFNESEASVRTDEGRIRLTAVTDRVEKQAALLLNALHSIYLALAAFASATLVTLLGTGVASFHVGIWIHVMALVGLLLGFFGAGGLVVGCAKLFQATQLSLVNIRDEAAVIRERAARSASREKSG